MRVRNKARGYGVSVLVSHEHAGKMGAVHADVDVLERTDGGGVTDGEHVVRRERGGRVKAAGDGGSDDNPTEAEDVASWAGLSLPGRFWCTAPKLGRHVHGCPTRVVGWWHIVPPSITSQL